ncbi:hypothetical protein NSTCB13_04871 [Nostoc sp. DSM 114160]
MILTNFLLLWNETALGARGDRQVSKITDNHFSNNLSRPFKIHQRVDSQKTSFKLISIILYQSHRQTSAIDIAKEELKN